MILSALTATALGATVEVSPGDDIRTLTASLGPGSEIVFQDGLYTIEDRLEWTGQGTDAEPIVLRAKDGANPVIEITGGGAVAYIHDAAHIQVKGLTFRGEATYRDSGSGFNGIRIDNGTNVSVQDCTITDTTRTGVVLGGNNVGITLTGLEIANTIDGNGIYVGCGDASCWTQDSEIAGNYIHGLGGDWTLGIILEPGSQNVVVRDNVVHTANYRGIQVESTEYGEPNIVEGNAIWSVGDAGIGVHGAAIVRNNLIFNVNGDGIRSSTADGRVLEKAVISFNTIVNTTDWGIEIDDWAGLTGMVLANNVVANPTGYAFHADEEDLDANSYISANVFTGLVQGLDANPTAFQPGGGYGDFQDAEGWDFYPKTGSILVNAADAAGAAWVPEVDFNNSFRDGEFPDVGAYELAASTNPGWEIREGFKELVDDQGGEVGQVGGCCGGRDGKKGKDTDAAAAMLLLPLAGWWRRRRARGR